MTRTYRWLAVVCVLTLAVGASAPAAAQTDTTSYFDGLVTATDDGSLVPDIDVAWARISSGLFRTVEAWTSEAGAAETYADEAMTAFNQHNETITAWANERLTADPDYDVFAVHFHDRDGHNVTRYLVSDVAGANYTDARFVTPETFADLNRSVDYHVSLDWYVSDAAAEELERFVAAYAEPGTNISTSDRARLLAKYGGGIDSALWNGSTTQT